MKEQHCSQGNLGVHPGTPEQWASPEPLPAGWGVLAFGFPWE